MTNAGYVGQPALASGDDRESAAREQAQGAFRGDHMAKPRIMIADDHPLVAAGLEQLLAPECEVIGTAYDGNRLLTEIRLVRPDIVVQDISMPPLNGIEIIRAIKQIDPTIKVVVVTMWDDPDLAAEAFRAGASAYILKNCAASELLDAVHCVMEQKSYVTPLIAGRMIHSLTTPTQDEQSPFKLTARQREILRLLAKGKSMKEVAAVLNVAVTTIAFHKYRIMERLKIKTTAELVRFAVVQNIV